MSTHQDHGPRDLFEIENAKTLNRDELVSTFVATSQFWRLLSSKNHIILGSRGSGKTALAKMLSHSHLSRLNNHRAKRLTAAQSFIGLYIQTSTEVVSSLHNKPWETEKDSEEHFVWHLNAASCASLLEATGSCLESYCRDTGERYRMERQLAVEFARLWGLPRMERPSFVELKRELRYILTEKAAVQTEVRVLDLPKREAFKIGTRFHAELFTPVTSAMKIAKDVIGLKPTATWLVCIDEAEYFRLSWIRILNSVLRSHVGEVNFKITTMPYHHETLETNLGVPLDVGDDFDYVYIDRDPIRATRGRGLDAPKNPDSVATGKHSFAHSLFTKRARASGAWYLRVTLERLLGPSPLLDADGSVERKEQTLQRIAKYGSDETNLRARRLGDSPSAMGDQMVRKLSGAALLREAVEQEKGQSQITLYSGSRMAITCGDAHPRRLIRLFSQLVSELPEPTSRKSDHGGPLLDPKQQSRILLSFSGGVLLQARREPSVGPDLYTLIHVIGSFMRHQLHGLPMTTDQILSVHLRKGIPPFCWRLVKVAVGMGLLFPNVSPNNPDIMPEDEGTFHLAFALAPYYRLLPRRGKSRSLDSILKYGRQVGMLGTFPRRQAQSVLFDEGSIGSDDAAE